MRPTHSLIVSMVIAGLAFVPAVACRSTPDVPEQTGEGPIEPSADSAVQQAEKEHKEPVELKPVGLGGGPQDESSSAGAGKPTPTPKPTPKPTGAPKPTATPSTQPTLTLPPWPTTYPSQWWPFPSPSATQGPTPPTPGGGDAGKDWAAPTP
jgi:hypothetical protein